MRRPPLVYRDFRFIGDGLLKWNVIVNYARPRRADEERGQTLSWPVKTTRSSIRSHSAMSA